MSLRHLEKLNTSAQSLPTQLAQAICNTFLLKLETTQHSLTSQDKHLSRTGPTGLTGPDNVYVGDYFMPSNTTITFTVNDTPTSYFQEAPLPTSYWERPIKENNQFWSVIGGHWLGQNEYGATYMKYNPYGRAPNTAHVINTISAHLGRNSRRRPCYQRIHELLLWQPIPTEIH